MGNQCFHCGLDASGSGILYFDDKTFCCNGCKTVYEIFTLNGLASYYDLDRTPGAAPLENAAKYDFLDNDKIVEGLLEFNESGKQIVSLNVPHIHCSACIWILENLRKLQPKIVSSQVNFHEKNVRISYDTGDFSLKELVGLLAAIGYEPYISLDDYKNTKPKTDHGLTYRLGVAFFCFGNIMLLSFPEYFEQKEFWLDQYKGFFRWLIFGLSLPSFFYSASGYYIAAYKSIRAKMLNIEIPIALGIVVMFARSVVDLLLDRGPGFFDSMTGLVFFMLLGKMFQQKTYKFLNFERDFKSYFPIAVTRIEAGAKENNIPVYDLAKGDRLLIRNMEIIPADGILISPSASIDYSFVTGEAIPVVKHSGDKLFAGGRQVGPALEMELVETVSQSYLTQLWGNAAFQKTSANNYRTITDAISRYFTPALLLIAFAGFAYWIFIDTAIAFNVFTAVLIVACPCALALTAPFTLGNVLRIFGAAKFYLKDTAAIEQAAKVDTIVFDKTGTITTNAKAAISFEGSATDLEYSYIKNAIRASNHPLSRMLYEFLPGCPRIDVSGFDEVAGKGISAIVNGHRLLIGSAAFTNCEKRGSVLRTAVHVAIDGRHIGKFIFHNRYREGMVELFSALEKRYTVIVLSGDNDGEREVLQRLLSPKTQLVFNRKPDEKLQFIEQLQSQGRTVMMVGDGLNDAGALKQSNVGVAISENVNVFSPACDAILAASEFSRLDRMLKMSKKAMLVIKMSFALSLLYNVVGLSFAITGNLLPIVAAVIMPLSTVTIISFVTIASNYYARRLAILGKIQNGDSGHILSKNPKLILTPDISQ